MTEAPHLTADYYRAKAREIRRFALRARCEYVCIELLDLAERFDRMAAHAEGREQRESRCERVGSKLERAPNQTLFLWHPMSSEMGEN